MVKKILMSFLCLCGVFGLVDMSVGLSTISIIIAIIITWIVIHGYWSEND